MQPIANTRLFCRIVLFSKTLYHVDIIDKLMGLMPILILEMRIKI